MTTTDGQKQRIRSASFGDHFSQALQFFNSQTEPEQNHIISAFIFELSKVDTKPVRERMLGQLANVDPTIAKRIADGLGMPAPAKPVATTVPARKNLVPSPALSILAKAVPTLKGRKVGCLISDGSDSELILALETASTKLGADFAIIAPKVGGATTSDGKLMEADFQLAGGPSILFDTVFVALSADAAQLLSTEAAAVAWVHDAYAHLKIIGATPDSQPLLDAAGAIPDDGLIVGTKPKPFLTAATNDRFWDREPNVRTSY